MADPKFLENLNIPGVGALVVSDANAVKGAGISAATSVQNNDTTVPTGKAVTTELNKKQNTLTAGTGLAFGTGADANKLGHSNSVTAKTSSSVKKFTYDAYGHVTGSSELSTAESDALASGIDSTKVAQIETNKNNILTVANQSTQYNFAVDNSFTTSIYKIVTIDTLKANTTYVICFGTLSSTDTDDTKCAVNLYYNGGSAIVQAVAGRGDNIVLTVTPTNDCNQLYLYAALTYANSVGDTLTVSNLQIVEKTIWDKGFTTYQPYALSNAELTTNKQDKLLTGYSATVTPTSQQTIVATDSVVEGFEKLDNNVRLNENNILTLESKNGSKNYLNYDKTILQSLNTGGSWADNVWTMGNGVTLTVNADNSITLNGTSTAGKTIYLAKNLNMPSDTYILSMTTSLISKLWAGISAVGGGEYNFTAPNSYISQSCQPNNITIYIDNGCVLDNLTLYPMLCDDESWAVSHNYQQYAMSNAEITAWIKAHS